MIPPPVERSAGGFFTKRIETDIGKLRKGSYKEFHEEFCDEKT
jgi:hypothetical protein